MEYELKHFRCADRVPTLRKACVALSLHLEQIDETFGIIALDPEEGLYVVKVQKVKLPV